MTTGNMRLSITDGTADNTVSVIATLKGSHLMEWIPKTPQAANAIWASSPYQDGKHLVNKKYDNIVDTFTIVVNGEDTDTTIHNVRKFLKLLEKAIIYWTDEYSTHKYWIEARAECETNIRYAIVVDYSLPEGSDPYAAPFSEQNPTATDEMALIIEHTIWTDSLTIGTTTDCVKITAGRYGTTGAHTDVPHGTMTSTCLRAPAVVPYWNGKLLTHAYWMDADAGPAWSSNLVDYGLGNNDLLPAVPAVGDGLYCCILDNAPADYGTPFTNLVIHLATKSVDITTVSASVSNGAGGWIAIVPCYNTVCPLLPAADLGVNVITWPLVAGWLPDTYHGVLGYWVKFEVTAIGGAPAAPEKTAANPVYTVTWPYIKVAGDEIKGDISAIINFLIGITKGPGLSNVVISTRKVSRTNAYDWSNYIPMNPHQIPTGVNLAVVATPELTLTQDSIAYTGWLTNFTIGAADIIHGIVGIFLYGSAYVGRYRVLIRANVNTGAVNEFALRLRIAGITGTYETPWVYNAGAIRQIFDMGFIEVPVELALHPTIGGTGIDLEILPLAAVNIDFYDMILLPVDEAYMEISLDPTFPLTYDLAYPLEIITSDFKQGPYGLVLYEPGPDYTLADWTEESTRIAKVTILGSFNLDPEEEYYIYFFCYDDDAAAAFSYFQYMMLPSLDKAQRYLLSRGAE